MQCGSPLLTSSIGNTIWWKPRTPVGQDMINTPPGHGIWKEGMRLFIDNDCFPAYVLPLYLRTALGCCDMDAPVWRNKHAHACTKGGNTLPTSVPSFRPQKNEQQQPILGLIRKPPVKTSILWGQQQWQRPFLKINQPILQATLITWHLVLGRQLWRRPFLQNQVGRPESCNPHMSIIHNLTQSQTL